jgi:hypothetical protein
MAALLSAAVLVSESPSNSELRVRISVFARALYENVDPKGLEPIRHRFGFTPAVTDAICDHLRRFRRQTYFDAAHRPSTPRAIRAAARHVPELIWHDAWEATYRHLLPTAQPTPARRFCALALAKHLTDGTWADAALALGLSASYSKSANHFVSRLADEGKQAIFRAEIARTAGELGHSRPLVDYAARRQHLTQYRRVPRRVLTPTGIVITPRRQQFAAAWLWSHATEGDPFRSPAMPSASLNDKTSFRRFQAQTLPSIRAALSDYVSVLLA